MSVFTAALHFSLVNETTIRDGKEHRYMGLHGGPGGLDSTPGQGTRSHRLQLRDHMLYPMFTASATVPGRV